MIRQAKTAVKCSLWGGGQEVFRCCSIKRRCKGHCRRKDCEILEIANYIVVNNQAMPQIKEEAPVETRVSGCCE